MVRSISHLRVPDTKRTTPIIRIGAVFHWRIQLYFYAVIVEHDLTDKQIDHQLCLLLQGFGVELSDHTFGDLGDDLAFL